jgi:hypothetical protein
VGARPFRFRKRSATAVVCRDRVHPVEDARAPVGPRRGIIINLTTVGVTIFHAGGSPLPTRRYTVSRVIDDGVARGDPTLSPASTTVVGAPRRRGPDRPRCGLSPRIAPAVRVVAVVPTSIELEEGVNAPTHDPGSWPVPRGTTRSRRVPGVHGIRDRRRTQAGTEARVEFRSRNHPDDTSILPYRRR